MAVVLTQTTVTVPTAGVQIVAANSQRSYLRISNEGAAAMEIRIGSATSGFTLAAGASWEPTWPPNNPITAVSKGALGASTSANIVQG